MWSATDGKSHYWRRWSEASFVAVAMCSSVQQQASLWMQRSYTRVGHYCCPLQVWPPSSYDHCHRHRRLLRTLAARKLTNTMKWNIKRKLECVPMPNVMAALPSIVGALCSTPQSLADAHYQSAVQKRCKDAKPAKICWVPQINSTTTKLPNRSQPLVGRSSPYCEEM